MYAVIRVAGKQVIARPDEVVDIPRIQAEAGALISCDEVLAFSDGTNVRVGSPRLEGVKVVGEVVGHRRADKILMYKMRRRKGYRKTQGHVQEYTRIRIKEISA